MGGEMAYQLRALAAIADDPGSPVSDGSPTPVTPAPGDPVPTFGFHHTCLYTVLTDTQT